MNMLLDKLPLTLEIEGVEYEINSDFRTSIKFELLMEDSVLEFDEKIIQALKLYYPRVPKIVNDIVMIDKYIPIGPAIDKILWFYRCGKDIRAVEGKGTGKSVSQIYSFEYDDDYIFSAFLDQYRINLQSIEYLHWWEFKAMFKALKEDNEIVKIMGYRSMNTNQIKDKEQREYYNKMKKIYEIPKPKDEIEKNNAIKEALLNGGDLTGIL